jgi:hypothetical protein
MKKKKLEKFFIDQDESCHWYVILASHRKEWREWRNLDQDDEKAWTAPDYAQPIGYPLEVEFYL